MLMMMNMQLRSRCLAAKPQTLLAMMQPVKCVMVMSSNAEVNTKEKDRRNEEKQTPCFVLP